MTQALLTESGYATQTGKILHTEQMTKLEKFFEISLPGGKDLNHAPGQFVMVSIPGIGEAPISVSSSPTKKASFDLVVRNAGILTGAMHNLEEGDTVGIRGPFGRGIDTNLLKGKDILMVAGGCGFIPMRSLINYVLDNRDNFNSVHVLLGCKTPADRLFLHETANWEKRKDLDFQCTVDKGDAEWKGRVGLITKLIPDVSITPSSTYAVVIGPPIMYKFVIKELLNKNIPDNQIILSLERHMKCGVGKCGHCQINQKYCCQDGPVFTYDELKELNEAI